VVELSCYFHIPLCKRKCPYCHFYTVLDRLPFCDLLMEGLFLEWERVASFVLKKRLVSLYFGGGTPYLLGAERLGSLLKRIPRGPGCEITLEANPEEVTKEGVEAFVRSGINRMSLGVQSFDDALLRELGRRHTAKRAKEAIAAAREGGIENLSIDLMYDIPKQTMQSWEESLNMLKDLPFTHLSLYNLTFEPKTGFYKRRRELSPSLPDSEASKEMLERAVEALESYGLKRYEISAFAKAGAKSKHNTGYWTARPFLGLGPSAFSYVDGRRFQNVSNLRRYVEALREGRSACAFEERLPHPRDAHELLALHLRIIEGVDLEAFQRRLGRLHKETLSLLHTFIQEGYLRKKRERLCLTERGLLFYDDLASELVGLSL